MRLYGIIGAGGFGREVMPLAYAMLQQSGLIDYELVFVEEQKNHSTVNHYAVLSVNEFVSHPASEKYFNIAIASHQVRERIANMMINRGARPFQINALNRVELENNVIGEGAIFCPFTTVTSNASIGKFFHANIYSYIAHDCVIGDYVTFAPYVQCNGGVIIEDYAYIGTGVVIKQGSQDRPMIIGKGATLGMGSVVTKSVPAYTTVVGNPARVLSSKESISTSTA